MADGQKDKKKNKNKTIFFFAVPILLIIALCSWGLNIYFSPKSIETSEGMALLNGKTVEKATLNEESHTVVLQLTKDYKTPKRSKIDQSVNLGKNVSFTYVTPEGPQVVEAVKKANLAKGYNSTYPVSSWTSQLISLVLPILLLFGLLVWFTTRMQGGGLLGIGKSKAKKFTKERTTVTFKDVAGVDEALEELQEIQDFIVNPASFRKLGAKVPKGVLLYGQPGCGKTLLAKALAGETNIPFFSISGSEFVELYAGMGASRVRSLFEEAKREGSAIIFIDEIDTIGRHRGSSLHGGQDEREQTLNQLLVEMDGFDDSTNILLIAGTNRPDVLDPALIRPGRFDRQIAIEAPDMKGREAILRIHAKDKPMAKEVDLAAVAKRTPGFTGADLANVMNEAALLTARSKADLIDNRALDEAIDRTIAGPQKRTRIMKDDEKKKTAYHEAGHALAAAALRHTDPVTKVTILPRGRALGYTLVVPSEDKYSKTRNELLDDLVYAMGGRVAEELVYIDPTTGASNDIEKATAIARNMVTLYGMTNDLGAVKLGVTRDEYYGSREQNYSEKTSALIDEQIKTLVENAHKEALEILIEYRDVLDKLVLELLEKETLNEAELAEIFATVKKRPERPIWRGIEADYGTYREPVKTPAELKAEQAQNVEAGDSSEQLEDSAE